MVRAEQNEAFNLVFEMNLNCKHVTKLIDFFQFDRNTLKSNSTANTSSSLHFAEFFVAYSEAVASGGGNAVTPPPRNRKHCCRNPVLSSGGIYFKR